VGGHGHGERCVGGDLAGLLNGAIGRHFPDRAGPLPSATVPSLRPEAAICWQHRLRGPSSRRPPQLVRRAAPAGRRVVPDRTVAFPTLRPETLTRESRGNKLHGRGERILVVTPRHVLEQMQGELWQSLKSGARKLPPFGAWSFFGRRRKAGQIHRRFTPAFRCPCLEHPKIPVQPRAALPRSRSKPGSRGTARRSEAVPRSPCLGSGGTGG
jgi:hypothetical protein